MTLPRHRSKTSKPTEIEPNASNTAILLVINLKVVREQFNSLQKVCSAELFSNSIKELKVIMKKTAKISEQKQIELAIYSPKSASVVSEMQVEDSLQEVNRLKVQISQFQKDTTSAIENFYAGIRVIQKKQVSTNYQDLVDRLEKLRSQAFGSPSGIVSDGNPEVLFRDQIQATFQQVENLLSLSTNFIVKNETVDYSEDNQKIKDLETEVVQLKTSIHDLKKQFDEALPDRGNYDVAQVDFFSTQEALRVIKEELNTDQSLVTESFISTMNELENLQESYTTTIEEAIYGSPGDNPHLSRISKLRKELRDLKKRKTIIDAKTPPLTDEVQVGKNVHKIDFPLYIMIILGAFLLGYLIRGKGGSK